MLIHIVNGPNLNLLSQRNPKIYGGKSLPQIEADLKNIVTGKPVELAFFQSNHEGEIIDYLQRVSDEDRVIINPGGLTHTSVSLRDCIESIKAECIEIHISNIAARESFRQISLISGVCKAVISGFGTCGYEMALTYLINVNKQ